MKQVYAAGQWHQERISELTDTPAPGHRLHLPTLRGSSGGVEAQQLQAVLPASQYLRRPASEQPWPVRLALLNTPNGRVLTHVTPHAGGFFAHTLLNVPDTADAQLAIQTWGSPLWQRHDPHATIELPEMPYLPVADVLDDAALQTWLGLPQRQDLVEFTLHALLSTPPQTRVFLAAPAEDVAKVVYAITRALPAGLLEAFSFSTYEADPLACPARLIGFEPASPDEDLPAACYNGRGVALNLATGLRSDLAQPAPFAAYAAAALTAGQFAQLDDIKATWQRLGMRDARQLELVYRLTCGTDQLLTRDEAVEALQVPPLAAWLAGFDSARQQWLGWALEDRSFATGSFSRAVQTLRQKPDVLAQLAATVREEGLRALHAGDRNRAANALEVILPMVAPTRANAVWGELLAVLHDPDTLGWEMRCYLLPRLVRHKLQQNPSGDVDPVFTPWLGVPAARLAELLALDLPRGYQLAACRACLKLPGEPSPLLAQTLASHPALTRALLQPESPGAFDGPALLFQTLLRESPASSWFEEAVAHFTDYPPELLNQFFEATLNAGKVDADRLIRTQGGRLLELFSGRSGLDTLGQHFLAHPPADILSNRAVVSFLKQLRGQDHLSADLQSRLDAVLEVRAYLDDPSFEPVRLQALASALAVTPTALPPTTRQQVFAAVCVGLIARAHEDSLQDHLETALQHLGPILAQHDTDLYENILRELRSSTDFARSPRLVSTFLALALGAARSPALQSRLDGLDGQAYTVASDAGKRGGQRVLAAVDAAARDWPKESQVKWGFLRTAVRPQGWQRRCRDAAYLTVGAAIASLGWWIAAALK